MTFKDLAADVNLACLEEFGEDLTLTYAATGESVPITGILCAAEEAEAEAPGDRSTYAKLFMRAGAVAPMPANGDRISSVTAKYVVLTKMSDEAGGVWFLLRFAAEI